MLLKVHLPRRSERSSSRSFAPSASANRIIVGGDPRELLILRSPRSSCVWSVTPFPDVILKIRAAIFIKLYTYLCVELAAYLILCLGVIDYTSAAFTEDSLNWQLSVAWPLNLKIIFENSPWNPYHGLIYFHLKSQVIEKNIPFRCFRHLLKIFCFDKNIEYSWIFIKHLIQKKIKWLLILNVKIFLIEMYYFTTEKDWYETIIRIFAYSLHQMENHIFALKTRIFPGNFSVVRAQSISNCKMSSWLVWKCYPPRAIHFKVILGSRASEPRSCW